jgi:hypothetical protein
MELKRAFWSVAERIVEIGKRRLHRLDPLQHGPQTLADRGEPRRGRRRQMLRCTVEEMDRGGHDRSLDSTDSFAAGYGGNRINCHSNASSPTSLRD